MRPGWRRRVPSPRARSGPRADDSGNPVHQEAPEAAQRTVREMAQGWPAGNPCDLLREHIGLNPTSFSVRSLTDADFSRETANIDGMPARTTHVYDTTAYAGNGPDADSWQERARGGASPAPGAGGHRKPTAGGAVDAVEPRHPQ